MIEEKSSSWPPIGGCGSRIRVVIVGEKEGEREEREAEKSCSRARERKIEGEVLSLASDWGMW